MMIILIDHFMGLERITRVDIINVYFPNFRNVLWHPLMFPELVYGQLS